LVGEIEVVRENLPQYHFVHHKSYMTWHVLEPGPPRWKTGNQTPELWHGRIAIKWDPLYVNKFLLENNITFLEVVFY
jgi:hypothetical protein